MESAHHSHPLEIRVAEQSGKRQEQAFKAVELGQDIRGKFVNDMLESSINGSLPIDRRSSTLVAQLSRSYNSPELSDPARIGEANKRMEGIKSIHQQLGWSEYRPEVYLAHGSSREDKRISAEQKIIEDYRGLPKQVAKELMRPYVGLMAEMSYRQDRLKELATLEPLSISRRDVTQAAFGVQRLSNRRANFENRMIVEMGNASELQRKMDNIRYQERQQLTRERFAPLINPGDSLTDQARQREHIKPQLLHRIAAEELRVKDKLGDKSVAVLSAMSEAKKQELALPLVETDRLLALERRNFEKAVAKGNAREICDQLQTLKEVQLRRLALQKQFDGAILSEKTKKAIQDLKQKPLSLRNMGNVVSAKAHELSQGAKDLSAQVYGSISRATGEALATPTKVVDFVANSFNQRVIDTVQNFGSEISLFMRGERARSYREKMQNTQEIISQRQNELEQRHNAYMDRMASHARAMMSEIKHYVPDENVEQQLDAVHRLFGNLVRTNPNAGFFHDKLFAQVELLELPVIINKERNGYFRQENDDAWRRTQTRNFSGGDPRLSEDNARIEMAQHLSQQSRQAEAVRQESEARKRFEQERQQQFQERLNRGYTELQIAVRAEIDKNAERTPDYFLSRTIESNQHILDSLSGKKGIDMAREGFNIEVYREAFNATLSSQLSVTIQKDLQVFATIQERLTNLQGQIAKETDDQKKSGLMQRYMSELQNQKKRVSSIRNIFNPLNTTKQAA